MNKVKELLKELDIRPRKSMGQSFLISDKIAKKIVSAGSIKKGDIVLEIGPGLGILTDIMALSEEVKIYAVEKDERLYKYLCQRFKDFNGVKIINGDILQSSKFKVQSSKFKKIKLISNLPYSITLLFLDFLLSHLSLFEICIFTLQREVVDKICAHPNTKEYSSLSVFMQTYADVKVLFPMPASFFYPRPKVSSVTISIIPKDIPIDDKFVKVVKRAFQDRRKMLKNSLGLGKGFEEYQKRRPDSLSPDEFKKIAEKIKTTVSMVEG